MDVLRRQIARKQGEKARASKTYEAKNWLPLLWAGQGEDTEPFLQAPSGASESCPPW
jgi:hypothetical protein